MVKQADRIFYCLMYGLSWRMFHVHFSRMCILLLLGGMSYICLLGLVGLQCCSISLLVFCLHVLFIIESMILQSPTTIVELFSTSILSLFASYIWGLCCLVCIIIITSWWIDPSTNILCPCLSHNGFWIKVYFFLFYYCHKVLFGLPFAWEYLFTNFHFQPMHVLISKVTLL